MDNSLSARFYRLETEDQTDGSFEEILNKISELPAGKRERNVGADNGEVVIARLERISTENDFVFGEFVRRQTDNKPPEANADGLKPLKLADGGGLGHACAFRYHRPTSTLGIQHNPSGLSANRIRAYLTLLAPRSKFMTERIPTMNAMDRFRSGTPRTFEIEVASPTNLPAVEGEDGGAGKTVVEASRMLANAFEGLTVTVQVSMGRRRGALPKGPISSALDLLLGWRRTNSADVRRLRVKSKSADGDGDTEYISFLDEFVQEKTRIDLPDSDPEKNYEVREAQLSLWHHQNLPYFSSIYAK